MLTSRYRSFKRTIATGVVCECEIGEDELAKLCDVNEVWSGNLPKITVLMNDDQGLVPSKCHR